MALYKKEWTLRSKQRGGKLLILTVVCISTICIVLVGVIVGKLTTSLLARRVLLFPVVAEQIAGYIHRQWKFVAWLSTKKSGH